MNEINKIRAEIKSLTFALDAVGLDPRTSESKLIQDLCRLSNKLANNYVCVPKSKLTKQVNTRRDTLEKGGLQHIAMYKVTALVTDLKADTEFRIIDMVLTDKIIEEMEKDEDE